MLKSQFFGNAALLFGGNLVLEETSSELLLLRLVGGWEDFGNRGTRFAVLDLKRLFLILKKLTDNGFFRAFK